MQIGAYVNYITLFESYVTQRLSQSFNFGMIKGFPFKFGTVA